MLNENNINEYLFKSVSSFYEDNKELIDFIEKKSKDSAEKYLKPEYFPTSVFIQFLQNQDMDLSLSVLAKDIANKFRDYKVFVKKESIILKPIDKTKYSIKIEYSYKYVMNKLIRHTIIIEKEK